ncbi:hypothetical protein KC345_g31 [Hortaea werneckii]|nr:hypothetical protein KC345_g31 [Hortaea werneckii]
MACPSDLPGTINPQTCSVNNAATVAMLSMHPLPPASPLLWAGDQTHHRPPLLLQVRVIRTLLAMRGSLFIARFAF